MAPAAHPATRDPYVGRTNLDSPPPSAACLRTERPRWPSTSEATAHTPSTAPLESSSRSSVSTLAGGHSIRRDQFAHPRHVSAGQEGALVAPYAAPRSFPRRRGARRLRPGRLDETARHPRARRPSERDRASPQAEATDPEAPAGHDPLHILIQQQGTSQRNSYDTTRPGGLPPPPKLPTWKGYSDPKRRQRRSTLKPVRFEELRPRRNLILRNEPDHGHLPRIGLDRNFTRGLIDREPLEPSPAVVVGNPTVGNKDWTFADRSAACPAHPHPARRWHGPPTSQAPEPSLRAQHPPPITPGATEVVARPKAIPPAHVVPRR